jgi:hypothetical protein
MEWKMKACHLCKEDYEEVKDSLNMKQVAEFYGYKVNGKGFCYCPFHNDNHPSMKIYNKGFYCFSCGVGGDIITFVSRLYNLFNEQACLQLMNDFSLQNPLEEMSYRQKRERIKRNEERKKLNHFIKNAHAILMIYFTFLCEASRNPEDPHFDEALQNLDYIEYRIECLKEYPKEYYSDKKAVERIGEIERRITGWHGYHDSNGAVSG